MGESSGGGTVPSYLSLPLDAVLSAFAGAGPAPGGGSAAVIAVALAAALCTMAARLSLGVMAEAEAIAAETLSIGDDLAPLVDEDPRRYLGVIAARRSPKTSDPAGSTDRIAAALSEAADVPLTVLEAGARLAQLAARLAEDGNPNVRADALVAALLAAAGAEAAAALVRVNLAEVPGDGRLALAQTLLDETGTWVGRARRSVPT